MKIAFDGSGLLDYAYNSLGTINIALKKQDKAELFAFSKKIENRAVAEACSKWTLIRNPTFRYDFEEKVTSMAYSRV